MKKIFFVFNKQWKKKTFDKKYTFIETGLEMEGNNSAEILIYFQSLTLGVVAATNFIYSNVFIS